MRIKEILIRISYKADNYNGEKIIKNITKVCKKNEAVIKILERHLIWSIEKNRIPKGGMI